MITILIADDNHDIRFALKCILAKNGFEVVEATNGAEAVEIFLKFRPQIVLMDVEMPQMDGIEATRRIMQINPETVIIGITAHTDRKHDLLRAGAKDVLAKPFSGKVLVDLIRKYLSPGGGNVLCLIRRILRKSLMNPLQAFAFSTWMGEYST